GRPDLPGGPIRIDSSTSSQYISALLLVGARTTRGLTVHHHGATLPSRPHIDMTAHMLSEHGIQIDTPDEQTWQVQPGTLTALDRR
ncbi:hypothetical protein NPM08_33360, partial [Bacillus cereus]|uniref:hypothetical protein n=1 Tax=Bacillus cereus TaxID=1396 RepID=UPI002111D8BC